MLSFIPRILSLVFAPSPIVVVVSPSTLLFNDDKLALPLPSSSSLSALDQLRYVQTKFHIEPSLHYTLSPDEKQAIKSQTVVVEARKEESGLKVVVAGRRELGSSTSIPSCIEAAASKPLRDQRMQDKVDELFKLSRFEEEEEEEEEEELQFVFAEEEVKPVEIDEERLELAKVVAVEAAAAGLARRREQVEKRLHRAETLAILTGKPHRATELAERNIIEDRRLYNFLADSRKDLRLPWSGVLKVWEEGEQEEEEIKRQWRAARRPRVEVI